MLQINVQPFASDALEDAMRLAQTKALNSYTFSDCLNYLNYTWNDIYSRLSMVDDGYYSKTVRLTEKLTKIPPFVRNTIKIYRAQSPIDFNRKVYRESGMNDLIASGTYHISGTDLYCPDAVRSTIWLNYVPQPPMIFFTHHNRDPKVHDHEYEPVVNRDFSLYTLTEDYDLRHKITGDIIKTGDIIRNTPPMFEDQQYWLPMYVSCDFPYIFVTYKHRITGEHLSGFFNKDMEWTEYNPFAFTGRNSNVEYRECHWNDKTGMGVVVADWNEVKDGKPVIKELGWTPDTLLNYPAPEMYRYLVARLADKFSALNESNVMGVQAELVDARYAFEAFISKDKSAWKRIDNVNGPTIGDLL